MDERKPNVTRPARESKEMGRDLEAGTSNPGDAVATRGMASVSDGTSREYIQRIYMLNGLHQYISKHFAGRNRALAEDAWVGKIIIRSELAALAEILAEKGILDPEDYVKRTIRELDANITHVEKEHGLVRRGG